LDKTRLELNTWDSSSRVLTREEEQRAEKLGIAVSGISKEILTGVLVNRERKLLYPIVNGIPRMLTFRTGIGTEFQAVHGDRLAAEFSGYSLPNEDSTPGEVDILRTFSSEWVNYDWDGSAYWNLKPEAWFRCMRFALDLDRAPVKGKLVLEAGIGIGGVADYVCREEECELIGLDLGYAVDGAFHHFGKNAFLHLVQASVFAPPFASETFDFIYSFGVIHHTFSTRTAFDSLARLPKNGGRVYIWVYSPFDESRNLLRRSLMALENVIRPVLWRMPEKAQTVALAPIVPAYMAMQWLRSKRSDGSVVAYGFREGLHAARDRFTPPFVHRHTEDEVSTWFQAAGFRDLTFTSRREKPDFVPVSVVACTGVGGTRDSSEHLNA
jgi:SAM-dependent methyltransferase